MCLFVMSERWNPALDEAKDDPVSFLERVVQLGSLYLPHYAEIFPCTRVSAHTELLKEEEDTVWLLGHYHYNQKRRLKVSTCEDKASIIQLHLSPAALTYLYLKPKLDDKLNESIADLDYVFLQLKKKKQNVRCGDE